MCLGFAPAEAESAEPPKLTKDQKAYIKRMIQYGKEKESHPGKHWMYQDCRKNVNGTWYPNALSAKEELGRMVITGDSLIFEKVGEFPFEIVRKDIGPNLPDGGARERYIFKLGRPIYDGIYGPAHFYVVFRSPADYASGATSWHYRCMPVFALCPTVETANGKFEATTSNEMSRYCMTIPFAPYPND
jgi:hypothetical protein